MNNLMCSCIQSKKHHEIKVVAFGNVLVSYTAYLEDTRLFDRYKLTLDAKGDIDDATLSQISTEIFANKEQFEPKLGGSAINTVCVLKSLGTNALFFGACGKDDESEIVFELLKNANMERNQLKLQTVRDTQTGRRISLVYKDFTSLYTNNGASSKFSGSFLQQIEKEENGSFLRHPKRKQIFYIEGFFVPRCEAVTTFIVRHYLIGRHYLALNLSADYIVRINFPHMLFLANNALFIFGKRNEFEAFRECWGAKCIQDFAVALVKESKTPKIFVITNGAESVEMITNYGQASYGNIAFYTFHVAPVECATDTTGCGDVFVAAFLHEWLRKRSLSQCVQKAIFLARKSIQKNGQCSYGKDATEA